MESSSGSLDELQQRVLTILAGFEPPFILGGGGALALYLGHRTTRDLDLENAIASAPRKDGGFSPLTLAWVLRNFDVPSLAAATKLSDEDSARIDRFRLQLIDRLLSQ